MISNENKESVNHILCPACGSDDIETSEFSRSHEVPYGHPVNYKVQENWCRSCDERGDFGQSNDSVVETAIRQADHASVVAMVRDLGIDGHTMAAIERALGLPARTIFRWKSEKSGCSSAGLALLRVVRTYPWVLEVANSGFAPQTSSRELLKAAVELGCGLAVSAGYSVVATGSQSEEGAISLTARLQPQPSCTQARSSLPLAPPELVA